MIDDAVCRIADWVIEQHSLGRRQHEGHAGTRCRAHVILAAEGVRDEKRFASIERYKCAGYWWRCDVLRVTDLRERDHEAMQEQQLRAMSLIRRVMWCPVLRMFMRFSSFFEYSDFHFRVTEPRRT